MNARIRMILAGVAAACALAGCQGPAMEAGGEGASARPLVAKMNSPVPDVPVPVGFSFKENESQSGAWPGGMRVVSHVFVGSAPKIGVVQFYKKHMPEHGWTRRTDQFLHGTSQLGFYKDKTRENCQITIRDRGGWPVARTVIKIELYPAGDGETPGAP